MMVLVNHGADETPSAGLREELFNCSWTTVHEFTNGRLWFENSCSYSWMVCPNGAGGKTWHVSAKVRLTETRVRAIAIINHSADETCQVSARGLINCGWTTVHEFARWRMGDSDSPSWSYSWMDCPTARGRLERPAEGVSVEVWRLRLMSPWWLLLITARWSTDGEADNRMEDAVSAYPFFIRWPYPHGGSSKTWHVYSKEYFVRRSLMIVAEEPSTNLHDDEWMTRVRVFVILFADGLSQRRGW